MNTYLPMFSPVNPEEIYTWSVDGGLKTYNNLLFSRNVIGNGGDEFIFVGKQTLPKGIYILKGWVYIANGAKLTIESGSIMKGEKTSKVAFIVEIGGKLIAQGSQKYSDSIYLGTAQRKT